MEEIFRDIAGFEKLYQVSNHGRVTSLERRVPRATKGDLFIKEKILKHKFDKNGYPLVVLCSGGKCKNFKVHRLIAIAFIPNPDNKPFVNHINGIKSDFGVENLEWCTCKENNVHAFSTGLNYSRQTGRTGSKSQHAKPIIQVSLIDGSEIKKWDCAMDVENELGFNHTNISKVLTGKRSTAYGFRWRYA